MDLIKRDNDVADITKDYQDYCFAFWFSFYSVFNNNDNNEKTIFFLCHWKVFHEYKNHLSEPFTGKVLNKRPHMVQIHVSYSDVDRNNGS